MCCLNSHAKVVYSMDLLFVGHIFVHYQKRCRTMGQICPILLTRIWTLSPGLENNKKLKCWSGIFPTILTYMILLENYQNNIWVYCCSPIQETTFYSCCNLMKPGSQNGIYLTLNQLKSNRNLAGSGTLYLVWSSIKEGLLLTGLLCLSFTDPV